MLDKFIEEYNEAIYDTDRNKAMEVVEKALNYGVSPEDVVFKIVIPSIESMIKAFAEDLDTNLAQHFMTSQIASEVTEQLIPKFKVKPEISGCIVVGTAAGDLHSLGKRIVIGCLKAMMMKVVDLGVNVSAERFVEAAIEHKAQIIGISAMMDHTARGEEGCKAVRRLLQEKGVEDKIKIIVGGAPYRFSPDLYKLVEADATANDGITAGKIIADLIKGKNL